MKRSLFKFCVHPTDNILKTLTVIDNNAKGFAIVIDDDEKVVGVLTDGDIRRAFLHKHTLDSVVLQVCRRNIKLLNLSNSINDAVEMFKSNAIKFLPIVDNENRLCNIITKQQMHSLLLLDIRTDLTFDFTTLDDNIIEHEIYQRPWGFYKTTVMNDYFQSKIISVNPGSCLSLQSHNHREEYWIVAHGKGQVQIGESIIDVKCGSSLFIPKGCKHRLINTDSISNLIITEVQIGDYFGEDDIVRYEDVYGRS